MEEKTNNALEKAEAATKSGREREEQKSYETAIEMHKTAFQSEDELTLQANEHIEKEKAEAAEFKRRRMSNENSSKGGKKGLIAAVVSLGIATLILASALIMTYIVPSARDNALEYGYQRSFYDAVEQVDNIDLNLSKILATRDSGAIQRYLVDVAINSELAENDIQELPLKDESKFYTTKLINQIGDYAKYVNNKIINGEEITKEDEAVFKKLYSANLDLKEALSKTIDKMGPDFSFTTILEGGAGNLIISNFNQLQNLSAEYPELIYDGPFSDGQSGKQMKGLVGDEISANKALDVFNGIFARRGVLRAENVGETTGDMKCYNVRGKVKDDELFAQISKKGGKLVMFSFGGSCKEVKIDEEAAIERGLKFLSSLGIEDVKPTWINLANNVYTINFAYEEGDVIVYSDLIKIRVCAQTNTVIGMEAKSYYTNHIERNIDKPAISEGEAKAKVFEGLDINSTRLALVPIGNNSEKLCYEFSGEYNDSTYYVYIDAINGRQVEMFKVVKGTEGELLM